MFIHHDWINKSYTKLQNAIDVCDDCFELTQKTHYIVRTLCGFSVVCSDDIPEDTIYLVKII